MELEIPHLDNPLERKRLIRMLTIFRKLRKISRLRAKKLFDRTQSWVKEATITTGQFIEKDEEKYLSQLYKKAFPQATHPVFSIDPKLLGGVQMMWGDEMVELTLNQLRITN